MREYANLPCFSKIGTRNGNRKKGERRKVTLWGILLPAADARPGAIVKVNRRNGGYVEVALAEKIEQREGSDLAVWSFGKGPRDSAGKPAGGAGQR